MIFKGFSWEEEGALQQKNLGVSRHVARTSNRRGTDAIHTLGKHLVHNILFS